MRKTRVYLRLTEAEAAAIDKCNEFDNLTEDNRLKNSRAFKINNIITKYLKESSKN